SQYVPSLHGPRASRNCAFSLPRRSSDLRARAVPRSRTRAAQRLQPLAVAVPRGPRSRDRGACAQLLERLVDLPDDREQVPRGAVDRKSTRLNSSHVKISYAVFCLKKKII